MLTLIPRPQVTNARARATARGLGFRFTAAIMVGFLALFAISAAATPLDDYVAKPDPVFKYTKIRTVEKPNYTTTIYHMISQKWLDKSKVNRPLWEHTVLVTVPKHLKFTKALMFVGGGSNRKGDDSAGADYGPLAQIAVMTNSIVAEVKQIPNQPLYFVGDTMAKYKKSGRSEDALIAFCWDKYLKTGDPLWLPRLPMTKAVVRAMDLVQKEFPKVDGFYVAGGSKRGWTTWTVAAVDKRVIGITPAVIDVLNLEANLTNHHNAYGFWAPAVGNYVEMHVTDRIHTPQFRNLMKVVDPYSYINRMKMPKYILNASGDQFFPPDSWKFYFKKLKGDANYICYVPNAAHGLNPEAYFQLASFYHAVLAGTPLPQFTWKVEKDGSLTVHCKTKPSKVTQWAAYNPKARDFRLETLGPKYKSTPLTPVSPGTYVSNVKPAAKGWKAFFIQLQFPNPGFAAAPFTFTTGVSIVPDTYPGKKK